MPRQPESRAGITEASLRRVQRVEVSFEVDGRVATTKVKVWPVGERSVTVSKLMSLDALHSDVQSLLDGMLERAGWHIKEVLKGDS